MQQKQMLGSPAASRREDVLGVVYGFASYLLWGVFPLYFLALAPTGPWEIVSWRILLSLAFCVILLTVTRGWRRVRAIVRDGRLLGWTAVSGVLIFVNWSVYLLATLTGHVIEASLGYFINPIVTVLLGVIVLHERLRIAQWVAIAMACVAVVVIVVGYGEVPWIALLLAFSFGFYGLVKKQFGASVDAVSGLAIESAWLSPVAVGLLIWLGAFGGGLSIGAYGGWHTLLVALAGIVTAVPLLLFAASARRAPLSVVGMLQFVTPILQFIIGVAFLHESMTISRWIGFGFVWLALIVMTVDSLRAARRSRTAPALV